MSRSTPRITQDPSRQAAETVMPTAPVVRVAALLAPAQPVPTARNRLVGPAAGRPLGSAPSRDSASPADSRGRRNPAAFSAGARAEDPLAAAVGAMQAGLAAQASAQTTLSAASAQNQLQSAEQPVQGQIVGAATAMMKQAVESLVDAGKQSVAAQGQAFDKVR